MKKLNYRKCNLFTSQPIAEKIASGGTFYFSAAKEDIEKTISCPAMKQMGADAHSFDGFESHYALSYDIYLHIPTTGLSDFHEIQIRRRADELGINIFVCEPCESASHALKIAAPTVERNFISFYVNGYHTIEPIAAQGDTPRPKIITGPKRKRRRR